MFNGETEIKIALQVASVRGKTVKRPTPSRAAPLTRRKDEEEDEEEEAAPYAPYSSQPLSSSNRVCAG